MARYDKTTLWLVQKVWWEFDEDGLYAAGAPGREELWRCADLDFGEPICAFTTRDAAEFEADRLECEAREGKNPFFYGRSLEDRTSMPAGVFRDWLTDAGIDPPLGKRDIDWVRWWATNSGGWTPEQRDKVWHALDRVRFYAVVELSPAK